jgi:hypothetical protein
MTSKVLNTTTIIIATILVVSLVGIGGGSSNNSIISINKSYAQPATTTTVSPQMSSLSPSLPSSSSPLTGTSTSIIPPSSIPAISAQWARWVLQIPASNNPILDTTGAKCAINQNNNIPFWFLVGDFGGTVTRTCTIPKDRFIFFPVLNALVTDIPSPPGNIQQEQAIAKQIADATIVSSLRASVDNKQLSTSDIHRAQSVPFSFIAPQNEILGDPQGFGTGVTDGYWVILNPLSVGQHTIHFSGQARAIPALGFPPFSLDVTYHISVR